MAIYTSFEQYLADQSEAVKAKLLELQSIILEAVPNATPLINYNILAYALIEGGKRDQQIMIAGFAKHIGFYPGPDTMEVYEESLKEYKRAKGSVQFPLNKPLPKDLIIEMVLWKQKNCI